MKTEAKPSDLNRREFLKGSSYAALMAMMGGIPIHAEDKPAPDAASLAPDLPAVPVNCALIGCGAWGRELLQTLTRVPGAHVLALCDTYEPSLRRAAKAAPEAAQHTDYRQVLTEKKVQAVVVATPSHQHREIAVAALQAGKHVYCEAPLATRVEDARAIAQAARAAYAQHFQAGLQHRADPQVRHLHKFIRTGVMGVPVMVRSQWHKKHQWRFTSPNPAREQELNWRLCQPTSAGLMGEIGIHSLDLASWFLGSMPKAFSGFGSTLCWKDDGREVPDTIQAVVEYPAGVRFLFDCTLANSFDSSYDMFYGTESAIMWRDRKGWMFKEVDARLLGWEVYARKESFYKECGIVLGANATKSVAPDPNPKRDGAQDEKSALEHALEAFLDNARAISAGVEDYRANFRGNNPAGLKDYLASTQSSLVPCAGYREGLEATLAAIQANEAILTGRCVELPKEWFDLG